ncbi:MAG: hypothetical protein E7421_01140 [Ruminococcaceae bacterium]|nr:hypothetical protein [Oscillospiraceae bacterium]
MDFQLKIDTHYGQAWQKVSNGYVSATAFLGERYLDADGWAEIMAELKSPEDAVALVSKLNGSFAIALTFADTLFLCVDRRRTIPLFYEIAHDTATVYNHIGLDKIKQNGANTAAVDFLEYCLFIPGVETAAKGVRQVMAGQYLLINCCGAVTQNTYVSDVQIDQYPDREKLMALIDRKFIETTKRLITVLNGRRAVIPLSGGHDSRLIVYYLKHLGYDNILTYTYGPKGNFESETSKKVADFLGLEWHFVRYKPKKLQKQFRSEFRKVADYYSDGVSSVCVQEWYALNNLKERNIIKDGDVLVPGHSFDCISGSFILPRYVQNDVITKDALFADILWKHFNEGMRVLPPPALEKIRQTVECTVLKYASDTMTAQQAFGLYQRYNIAERQAKYICHQVRLYEYYGLSWYLPLWDRELVDFWESIPLKMKYNRQLFRDFTEYKYAALMAAAPIYNQKTKGTKPPCMHPVWRVIRKAWQLLDYVGTHYCLAYFSRMKVYKVFFSTKILAIGYMVNQEMKKLFLEE